jgi:hypothetical protein
LFMILKRRCRNTDDAQGGPKTPGDSISSGFVWKRFRDYGQVIAPPRPPIQLEYRIC